VSLAFHKYQALGNDYIVVERADVAGGLSPAQVRRLCDRHLGVGADGILLSGTASGGRFSVVILNPDGSEAEKSGNGLRILSRYLYDRGRVAQESFEVETAGGLVRCQVREGGRAVFVEMGTARFDSVAVPVAGPARQVVGEEIEVAGRRLRLTAVTVGNPHCVVHVDDLSPELALQLGPILETHELFPNRTNVQFVRVLDRRRISIEIWERGAGYTLASGSSSCAAAAASVRQGLCDGDITVLMPGGRLQIGVGDGYALTMLGPVAKVADGVIAAEVLDVTEVD